MRLHLSTALAAALALTSATAFPQTQQQTSAAAYQAHAQAALDRLQKWYNSDTGLWKSYGPSWWQSANALSTLLEMMELGSPTAHKIGASVVPGTFVAAAKWNVQNDYRLRRRASPQNGYINGFYDDMGWWAMAWLKGFDVTRERRYLDTAELLFEDMKGGWGTNCTGDGGMWWDKAHTGIAPISNTLFIEVAGWLANRAEGSKKEYYVEWGVRAWTWFSKSVMFDKETHLVDGGIHPDTCEQGENPPSYTYSNGALVGGLVALARATGEKSYMDEAHRIAAQVIKTMSKDGVLQEQKINQAHPGESAPQFKGVFMRGLSSLQTQSPRDEYKVFMQRSADSIWKNARSGKADLGPDWNGPFYGPANASPQSSAMDCLVAAWKHSK